MVLISSYLLNARTSCLHVSNARTENLTSLAPLVVEDRPQAISLLQQARSKRYSVEEAKQLHSYIVKSGPSPNIYYLNSLIRLYAANGALDDAQKLFDGVPHRDVVSWTTLVDGYAKLGKMDDAKELFNSMRERNVVSWNVMITGYGKQGNLEAAREMFDKMPEHDIASWNSLISSFARNDLPEEAFKIFQKVLTEALVMPNKVSFLSVLPAIAELGCALRGRCVHSLILRTGIELDGLLSSALVDMYCKCDCLDHAFQVLKTNQSRDNVASWNPLLAGLVRHKRFEEALDIFQILQLENVEPDVVTIITLIATVAQLGTLGLGKWLHAYAIRKRIRVSATLASALVDMYSKCGCVELALQVFSMAEERTVELWNAMINGLAIHGQGKDAIELFSQMRAENSEFDEVTLASILNACSHSGLVDDGLSFFAAMKDIYKMTPKIQHYGCIVDLLSRVGQLEEAKTFICSKMHMKPDAVLWKSLLGACKTHGNVEIGEFAARHLIELCPDDSSAYVLLSSIYDSAGRLNDAVAMRKMMSDGGVSKEPGFSLIESGGVVHVFLVGDRSHPRLEEVNTMLCEMSEKFRSVGYAPEKQLVLFDIDDQEKEFAISHHSEKLAIAFGLCDTAKGTPLHIVKNLRMCSDCHVFMKLASKIYDREIIVRDNRRFHHFKTGKCSCMDYW
ncbi:pentatricopeptide repeat-containing protein At1g08070, chloroplastic-like [Macadamia integrifolia]|uniref:pentatricopeptide repeat-containing protein At1g08070, chloroplastic-like n=1 Tax=Macadamia integrifolia TaxID=60698 RepID=UPI001C4E4647|nr:pentatricopeptide repeat-containing protein At1g08070, chloroplastic-like [Macadamia integrifolia]